MASIYIINSLLTTTTRVLADNVSISSKNNNDSKPNPNGEEIVEVQTQSIENPKYIISGIKFTGGTNTLSISDVYTLSRLKYDGTNPITLKVTYDDDTVLPDFSGNTDGISCVVSSFNIVVDARDNKNASLPSGTLTLMETK